MPTIGDRYVNATAKFENKPEHAVELGLVAQALEPRILARTDMQLHSPPRIIAPPRRRLPFGRLSPTWGDVVNSGRAAV